MKYFIYATADRSSYFVSPKDDLVSRDTETQTPYNIVGAVDACSEEQALQLATAEFTQE